MLPQRDAFVALYFVVLSVARPCFAWHNQLQWPHGCNQQFVEALYQMDTKEAQQLVTSMTQAFNQHLVPILSVRGAPLVPPCSDSTCHSLASASLPLTAPSPSD